MTKQLTQDDINYNIVGRDDDSISLQVNFYVKDHPILDRTLNIQLPLDVLGGIPTGDALDAYLRQHAPLYDFQSILDRYKAAPFVDLEGIAVTPADGKPLEQVRLERRNLLGFRCTSEVENLTRGIAVAEVQSWGRQEREARAFLGNPEAGTPMLDAIVQQTGADKVDLANRVVANADAYAALVGKVIGRYHALTAQLDAIDLGAPDAVGRILNVK